MVNLLDKVILSKSQIVKLEFNRSHILGDKLYLSDYYVPSLRNVEIDDRGQALLKADNNQIALGKATQNPTEISLLDFSIDEGDSIQFSNRHSFLAWLTPFEINLVSGGPSPYKKRYVYYTLTWTKKDGSRLRARWKFEQWKYHTEDGWGSWNSAHIIDGKKDDLIDLVIEKK